MKRMSQIRAQDRPREKLQAKGAVALSDFELLQALIGSGNKYADVLNINRLTPSALTALTVLVAESNPNQKDKTIKLILNLISKNN